MPIVAHNDLPSLQRLREAGTTIVLPQERAARQDIRELHIGLLNMMPDAALEATDTELMAIARPANSGFRTKPIPAIAPAATGIPNRL